MRDTSARFGAATAWAWGLLPAKCAFSSAAGSALRGKVSCRRSVLTFSPCRGGKGGFSRSPIAHHPPAELPGRLQADVERLRADPPLHRPIGPTPIFAQARPVRLSLAGQNVAPQAEPTASEHFAGAACDKLGMAGRVPLRQQRRFPVAQVLRQRLTRGDP